MSRKALPKPLRNLVWDTYIGREKGIGPCFTCGTEINSKHYECGHVVSVADGGTDHISNLRPICELCNKSMGIKNLLTFKDDLSKMTTPLDLSDDFKLERTTLDKQKLYNELNSLKVEQLKFICEKLNTTKTGIKKDLIARIFNYITLESIEIYKKEYAETHTNIYIEQYEKKREDDQKAEYYKKIYPSLIQKVEKSAFYAAPVPTSFHTSSTMTQAMEKSAFYPSSTSFYTPIYPKLSDTSFPMDTSVDL